MKLDQTTPAPDEIIPARGSPHKLQDALNKMRDPGFLKTAKYNEQQLRANREFAHKDIMTFEKRFVKEAARLRVPLFAHEIYRTQERQRELAKQGKSKLVDGAHQRGAAVDIIHSIKGWELTRDQWNLLGHLGKEVAARSGIDLVWGGDWNFWDPAHWELRDWRDLPPF